VYAVSQLRGTQQPTALFTVDLLPSEEEHSPLRPITSVAAQRAALLIIVVRHST
jgi:hypothetical protein